MLSHESPIERYDRLVEQIRTENDLREARGWLEESGESYGVIHEMNHEDSCLVVEECYARGATVVEAAGQLEECEGVAAGMDMLIVHLPEEAELRGKLFEFEACLASEMGFDGCVDEGQKYLLLRWT